MSEDTSGEQGKPEPAAAAGSARPTGWLWTAELAVMAWLVLLAASALIIGAHDAVAGTEISVRLLGSLLVAAGVLLLSGAAGLWHRKPVGLSLAMIAALLGVAMGVLIFLTQVVNDEPDGRLAGWTLIVVVSVVAAVYIRRLTPPSERAKGIWTRLPILKSAVAWISMGRGTVLGLEDVKADSLRTKHGVVFLTRLPEAGWLRRLTRGDRYVRAEYPSDATEFPTVWFAPDTKPDPPKDFDRRLDRFYGVDETASRDIRSLP